MKKEELIKRLKNINKPGGDIKLNHCTADGLLLEFINDPEITQAFADVDKWYA